jgi:hypothetical protein
MSSTVSLWAACIKDLQDQTFVEDDVPPSAVKALLQASSKLEQQPPLPSAAWKKLVQDVQVNCAGMGVGCAGQSSDGMGAGCAGRSCAGMGAGCSGQS